MSFIVAFQGSIAATNTAQNLPSNPVKTVTIAAKTGNTAAIAVGNASTVTTGTGFVLAAGQSVSLQFTGGNGNTNSLWVVGTLNDVYSVIGS